MYFLGGGFLSAWLERTVILLSTQAVTRSTLSSPRLGAAQSQVFFLFPVLLAKG